MEDGPERTVCISVSDLDDILADGRDRARVIREGTGLRSDQHAAAAYSTAAEFVYRRVLNDGQIQ